MPIRVPARGETWRRHDGVEVEILTDVRSDARGRYVRVRAAGSNRTVRVGLERFARGGARAWTFVRRPDDTHGRNTVDAVEHYRTAVELMTEGRRVLERPYGYDYENGHLSPEGAVAEETTRAAQASAHAALASAHVEAARLLLEVRRHGPVSGVGLGVAETAAWKDVVASTPDGVR